MGFNKKNAYSYAIVYSVPIRNKVEELNDQEEIVERTVYVEGLNPQVLNTPPASNFDLESQVAAGQPLKRIDPAVLTPQIPSDNAIRDLAYTIQEEIEKSNVNN